MIFINNDIISLHRKQSTINEESQTIAREFFFIPIRISHDIVDIEFDFTMIEINSQVV